VLTSHVQSRLARLVAIVLLGGAVLAGSVVGVPEAARADYLVCEEKPGDVAGGTVTDCRTELSEAGQPGDPSAQPSTGLTPGPDVCLDRQIDSSYLPITCALDIGYWSNARQCYQKLADPQRPPPAGSDPVGAWYDCMPPPPSPDECTPQFCRDQFGVSLWLTTPPPGITTLTPGQAARNLVASFRLESITVGFAPDPNTPGSRSYVGVPIWMWVENPSPLSYGPYVQSATLGGVTITATAQVTSVIWNMGDGTTVSCAAGTPYVAAMGAVTSPNCGHRYARTSASQPGGTFPVTATSQWQVSWEGGGASGVIPLTTTATTAVQINEIQSVNVGPGA
jgi:hypothetical protein